LNELLDLVSKRWFSDVLFCIQEGNNRFKLIKDDLKFISDTILSDRLKLLERYGLINRTDFDEIPPKVEYSLTEKGEELSALLGKMCEFSDILPPKCGPRPAKRSFCGTGCTGIPISLPGGKRP